MPVSTTPSEQQEDGLLGSVSFSSLVVSHCLPLSPLQYSCSSVTTCCRRAFVSSLRHGNSAGSGCCQRRALTGESASAVSRPGRRQIQSQRHAAASSCIATTMCITLIRLPCCRLLLFPSPRRTCFMPYSTHTAVSVQHATFLAPPATASLVCMPLTSLSLHRSPCCVRTWPASSLPVPWWCGRATVSAAASSSPTSSPSSPPQNTPSPPSTPTPSPHPPPHPPARPQPPPPACSYR